MSVNLIKGQKVDLTKGNTGLKNVLVGLGWDEVKQQSKGLFGGIFSAPASNIDCDASVFLCGEGGKLSSGAGGKISQDVVYFGNLTHKSGAVRHQGDNLTGAGDGDDEQVFISLNDVPQNIEKIAFVVNIYQAKERKQHFGLIQNAFIRLIDADKNVELCRFNLSENYDGKTAMIMGEIYKNQSEWKFNALGEGTTDNGLLEVAKRF